MSRNITLQRGQPAILSASTSIQGQGAACCALEGGADGPERCPTDSLQSLPPPQGVGVEAAADASLLNLASLSGIFVLPANGSLALCNLRRLEGAALPWTFPLPAASFLALSAFNLTAAFYGRIRGQPPPLQLSNLVIVTPSCPALSVHQAFACVLSPSPNFTITPTSLIVHHFTTPSASISNVTLTCATAAPAPTSPTATPFPCLAGKVSSGAELLAAIISLERQVVVAKSQFSLGSAVDAYLFLERSIFLNPSATHQGLQIVIQASRFVIAGHPNRSAVIDLRGTTSLISVLAGASMELHNLTVRNAPLGPPSEGYKAFLQFPAWTFAFGRLFYGYKGKAFLTAANVTFEVPHEELTMWIYDTLGPDAVPGELRANLCVRGTILAMSIDSAKVEMVQVPGKGPALLWKAGRSTSGTYLVKDVLMTTADGGGSWCSNGGTPPTERDIDSNGTHVAADDGDMGRGIGDAVVEGRPSSMDTTPPSPSSPPLSGFLAVANNGSIQVPMASPPIGGGSSTSTFTSCCSGRFGSTRSLLSLCLYVPVGMCGTTVMLELGITKLNSGTAGKTINSPSNTVVPARMYMLEPNDRVLIDVVQLSAPRDSAHWSNAPAAIMRPSLLMGSFLKAVVLDVSLLPGAFALLVNASSGSFNASLTIRAAVLVNLPPAGEYSSFVLPLPPFPLPPLPRSPVQPPLKLQPKATLAPEPLSRRRYLQQQGGLRVVAMDRAVPSMKGSGRPVVVSSDRHGGHLVSSRSSSSSINGGAKGMAGRHGRVRLVLQEPGKGAGADLPNNLAQGLDPALTNFTSCLWMLNFDRRAASARQELLATPDSNLPAGMALDPRHPLGLPYVFLDSVVAVVPQPELDVLVRVWATNSTAEAVAPGLADQLAGMLAGSRLSEKSVVAVAWSAATNATVSTLLFDKFWWCALEGYNVTLTSLQLPQQVQGIFTQKSLQLDLPVDYMQSSAAMLSRSPPPLLRPSPSLPTPLSASPVSSPQQLMNPPSQPPPAMVPVPGLLVAENGKPQQDLLEPAAAADRGRHNRKWSDMVIMGVALTGSIIFITAVTALFVILRRKQRSHKLTSKAMGFNAAGIHDDGMAADQPKAGVKPSGVNNANRALLLKSAHDTLFDFYGQMHHLTQTAAAGGGKADGGEAKTMEPPRHQATGGAGGFKMAAVHLDLGNVGPNPCADTDVDTQQQCDLALTISGELGRGAQGVVYRGVWRGLDVAVKSRLLQCMAGGESQHQGPPLAASDPTPVDLLAQPNRAIQEAIISTSLSHPNVVATYTYMLQRLGDMPQGNDPTAAASTGGELMQQDTGTTMSSSSQQGGRSAQSSATFAAELQVWKLTLVQELCDGNSLRHCLERGTLADCRSIKAADTQSKADGIWTHVVVPVSLAGGGRPLSPSGTGSQPQPAGSSSSGPRRLELRVMLLVALQAARGLAYLHRLSIVHADVSSANILLKCLPAGSPTCANQDGASVRVAAADPCWYGYVAKVCDFGLSGKLDDAREASHLSGSVRAVSAYSAPELVRHGHASSAGDMYAFAVVLWELALGCPLPALLARPEGARLQSWLVQQSRMDPLAVEPLPPSLLTWPDEMPPGLVELLGGCLREDPSARPSAQQLCDRLHGLLVGDDEQPLTHHQERLQPTGHGKPADKRQTLIVTERPIVDDEAPAVSSPEPSWI